ncbi:MAG: C2H2-type zinc finger protein [Nitrosopumilaceae archaeon]
MIRVDCRYVEGIKPDLAVYVSDQVVAVPTLKKHEFALSEISEDEKIDVGQTITAIKEFLDSIDEGRNFAVICKNDVISIESINGKKIEPVSRQDPGLFSCAHCGHVTPYEVIHNNHIKIHYFA